MLRALLVRSLVALCVQQTIYKFAECIINLQLVNLFKICGPDVSFMNLTLDVYIKTGFQISRNLCDFKTWLSQFDVQDIFANNCVQERRLLNMNVKDVGLPNWAERVKHRYHNIPQFCKKYGQPIFHVVCDEDNHRCFQRRDIVPSMKLSDKLKYAHGYHCSLADVYEVYLFYEEQYGFV